MRTALATTILLCSALAACGAEAERSASLPPTGTAYRALGDADRLAVAERCRERAAVAAGELAAEQLSRVDAAALRLELASHNRVGR